MAAEEKRRGADRAFAFLLVCLTAFVVLLMDRQHGGPRELW